MRNSHDENHILERLNSLDDFHTEMKLNLQYYESICDGAMWDQDVDEYTHPCDSLSNFNLYIHRDWDHWNDNDLPLLWGILMADNKASIDYQHAVIHQLTPIHNMGLEFLSHHDIFQNFEWHCRDSRSCYQLQPEDFLTHCLL